MKKALYAIYSLVTIFCLAYGIPMAIVNIGKDWNVVIISAIIGGIGLLLFLASVIAILVQKRKAEHKQDDPKE